MPTKFSGTLNTNEFYDRLFNAYRFMATLADELDGLDTSLANRFKFDGGAYNEKTVVSSMDILHSYDTDLTDTNVLAPGEKVTPQQQELVVDKIRQIALYTDQYLTKRAWMTPEAFESFNTVVQSEINKTKNVYEQRLVDVFIGTTEAAMVNPYTSASAGLGQSQEVSINASDSEDLRVRKVGKKIANILVDLQDSTRDFNDYGNMQSYKKDDLMIVWNADYLNEFNYVDLPVIFHKDGIINFVGEKKPGKYFGKKITASNYSSYSAETPTAGKPIDSDTGAYTPGVNHANGILRSTIAQDVIVGGTTYKLLPNDELPSGAIVYASSEIKIPCYIEDPTIICKIFHKDGVKFPTGFETSTEFFNAKNLSTNRYLTWMFGYPQYLMDRPFITLREKVVS